MKIEKRNLNEALRVLGKVVCQTSPVELYRSVRFVGNADGVTAMARVKVKNDFRNQPCSRLDSCFHREFSYDP